MSADEPRPSRAWESAWLDALACAIGLALAWWLDWTTTDLVWSLWLSSLAVGYAMIVWTVTGPLREIVGGLAADRSPRGGWQWLGVFAIVGGGTLFGLAFFTVHFGGFHFVHSAFLNMFFPLDRAGGNTPNLALYAEVFRRYWWFLPAAALAEREGFRRVERKPDTSVTAEAIKARLARPDAMMTPYRNVIRMHLLIFFFAFAHFAHLANFAVYAVAYAVYFFPWRLLRKPAVKQNSS